MASNYGIAPPGFRLPDSTHVGAVRLSVTDLERSSDFYTRQLGFVAIARTERSVSFGTQEGKVLIEVVSGARAPLTARRLGLYHFAILLPDRVALGRCLTHLLHNGFRPGAADHLVSEALYLQDPDGLGIEIYRDRPRSEWMSAGRELRMASETLDLEDVMSAGKGMAWDGLPGGTTIGHMHFHVGDLHLAKSFYHDALGMDLTVWSYPGALFLGAGGYHHHLGVNTWAGPGAVKPLPDEARLIDWELVLPSPESIAAAADSISAAGFPVSSEEPGGSVAVDPSGVAVRLTTPI